MDSSSEAALSQSFRDGARISMKPAATWVTSFSKKRPAIVEDPVKQIIRDEG